MIKDITSGPHLGVIRNWIKHRFHNGDQVRWGSYEPLTTNRSMSTAELERLAQDIYDAVMGEIVTTQQLDMLAREMIRSSKGEKISIHFDHHIGTASIDGEESNECFGLGPALGWVYRKIKKMVENKTE